MQARQRELQASGNLEEAKLKVNQAKEMSALESNQRKAAEEANRYADTQSYRAMRDARADWDADRRFNAQQEQWEKNYNMQYAKFKEEQGQ